MFAQRPKDSRRNYCRMKTMVPATSPHNRVIRLLIPSNLGDNMPERDAKIEEIPLKVLP